MYWITCIDEALIMFKMHSWVKLTQKNQSRSVTKKQPKYWSCSMARLVTQKPKSHHVTESHLANLGKAFIDDVTGWQGQHHPACAGHWKAEVIAKIQNPTFHPMDVLAPYIKHYYVFQGWTTRCTYTDVKKEPVVLYYSVLSDIICEMNLFSLNPEKHHSLFFFSSQCTIIEQFCLEEYHYWSCVQLDKTCYI